MGDREADAAVEQGEPGDREVRVDRVLVGPVAVEQERRAAVARASPSGVPGRPGPGCRRARWPRCGAARSGSGRTARARGAGAPGCACAGAGCASVRRSRRPQEASPSSCSRAGSWAGGTPGCRPSRPCRPGPRSPRGSRRPARRRSSSITRSWVSPSLRWLTTRWVANASTSSSRTAGVVGEQRLPLLVAGGVDRGDGQRVVLGVLVVQDQQPVLAGDDRVLDAVLDTLPPRRDHPELAGGVGGVEDAVLGGRLRAGADDDQPVAAGAADGGPEAFVGLVVHDDVVGDRGAEHVPPHLVGTPGVVDGRVEERGRGEVPGRTTEGVRHLVGKHLAGAQVLDLQQEPLVADGVGAEREQGPVGTDRRGAEREEVVPLGEDVGVEQHLLAGDVGVRRERRRSPVVRATGVGGRAAAADAVLLALDRPAVVPVPPDPGRHRQVGLQGAGLDLAEDRLAQRCEVGGAGLGVGVLRLEVGQRVRGLLVAQPLVVVDERVAVVGARVRHPLGHGRGERLDVRHGAERISLPVSPAAGPPWRGRGRRRRTCAPAPARSRPSRTAP